MVSADSRSVEAVSAERPLPGRCKFGSGRRVLSHLTRRVTDVLKDLPSNDRRNECREWVATRPPSLRIHRPETVSEISLPESGLSSPGSSDPIRPVTFLQTGQSAKSRFCELESPKRPLSTSHSGQLPPIVASGEPPSERLLHSATSPMAYSHCTARPNLSFTLLRGLRCTSASEHVVGRSNPTNSSRSRITQDGMQVVSVLRCHWAHRSIPIIRILPSPPWPS